ncbi:hypothetical protein [Latilactobacillus fuchuensis]|uniref:Uncharacterized protein n=1 Tax=Latilactobacillus fuchuensis TaxID=164393 RepID=A0A2N9DUW7_9LACO|nr:hypothetical protein [Latilactobacillus fuchuensis]SPC38243.1 conserved hypothetical protein [Latilactobacillus fuchuensis]
MSNLGWYQLLTTIAKKVGGPKVLIGLLLAGGYGIGRVTEASGKKIVKIIKKTDSKEESLLKKKLKKYTFTTSGKGDIGLEFNKDELFVVVVTHGASVLIEKERDTNNPYFVDVKWLETVSNYEENQNK